MDGEGFCPLNYTSSLVFVQPRVSKRLDMAAYMWQFQYHLVLTLMQRTPYGSFILSAGRKA